MTSQHPSNRENFGSRFAVIMAMAGSAIGLGNIWRFPYIAGEMGGGAFVLIYIACTLIFSIPIFLTETIIGRRSHKSAAGAMSKLSGGNRFWKAVGIILVMTPLFITAYYSVVGGWALDFFVKSLSFSFNKTAPDNVSGLFGDLVSDVWTPIIAHLAFLGSALIVVSKGVRSGIEKFSKFTVPILFLMVIAIMIYSFTLPGAKDGIMYLLKFDTNAFTPRTLAYAMGQSFYSMSLGMGAIITLGSYVHKDENILKSSVHVAASDLLFALLSAFAIMPAVFAAGLEPGAGPGLIFQSIPYIFSQMSAESPIISGLAAIIFFFTILIAALTSCVSLVEVGVAYLTEGRRISRKKASLILFVVLGAVGTLCSLGFGPLSNLKLGSMGIFDCMDWFSSNILLIVAALAATVFAGWFMKREDFCEELSNKGTLRFNAKIAPAMHFAARYLAPVGILAIFISNFIL